MTGVLKAAGITATQFDKFGSTGLAKKSITFFSVRWL